MTSLFWLTSYKALIEVSDSNLTDCFSLGANGPVFNCKSELLGGHLWWLMVLFWRHGLLQTSSGKIWKLLARQVSKAPEEYFQIWICWLQLTVLAWEPTDLSSIASVNCWAVTCDGWWCCSGGTGYYCLLHGPDSNWKARQVLKGPD